MEFAPFASFPTAPPGIAAYKSPNTPGTLGVLVLLVYNDIFEIVGIQEALSKLLWLMGVGAEADPQASLLPSQAPMVDSEQEKLLLSRTKQGP